MFTVKKLPHLVIHLFKDQVTDLLQQNVWKKPEEERSFK